MRRNERFRSLIQLRHDENYCTAYTTSEKRAVAEQILAHIRALDPPGRFLRRCGRAPTSRGLQGPWEELSDREIIKKTCQALRDCSRQDRTGYAAAVSAPEDVRRHAESRIAMGLSNKEQAAAAAAAKSRSEGNLPKSSKRQPGTTSLTIPPHHHVPGIAVATDGAPPMMCSHYQVPPGSMTEPLSIGTPGYGHLSFALAPSPYAEASVPLLPAQSQNHPSAFHSPPHLLHQNSPLRSTPDCRSSVEKQNRSRGAPMSIFPPPPPPADQTLPPPLYRLSVVARQQQPTTNNHISASCGANRMFFPDENTSKLSKKQKTVDTRKPAAEGNTPTNGYVSGPLYLSEGLLATFSMHGDQAQSPGQITAVTAGTTPTTAGTMASTTHRPSLSPVTGVPSSPPLTYGVCRNENSDQSKYSHHHDFSAPPASTPNDMFELRHGHRVVSSNPSSELKQTEYDPQIDRQQLQQAAAAFAAHVNEYDGDYGTNIYDHDDSFRVL